MSSLIDLAANLKSRARTQFLQAPLGATAPERPATVPETVWSQLDLTQQTRRSRDNTFNSLAQRASADIEQAVLLLKLALPNVTWSAEMRSYTEVVLETTVVPLKNPAITSLLRTISRALESGTVPTLVMSQCLEKGPGVRDAKLDYFIRGKCGVNIEQWYAPSFEGVGWQRLRRLLH